MDKPQTTTKDLICWLHDYANAKGHTGDDREKLYIIEARLRAYQDGKAMYEAMQAVLCDPEGVPCFSGSDGDRAIISDAMDGYRKAIP
jgi:hypothetical protein